LLVEHLKNDAQERSGGKYLSSDEIVSFLRYGIDEIYRMQEGQNIRQTKKKYWIKRLSYFRTTFFSIKSHMEGKM